MSPALPLNSRAGQRRKVTQVDPDTGETFPVTATRLSRIEDQLLQLAQSDQRLTRELNTKSSVEMLQQVEASATILTNSQIESAGVVEGLSQRVSAHSKRHFEAFQGHMALRSHQKALQDGLSAAKSEAVRAEEMGLIQGRWNIDASEAISELRRDI